MIDYAVAMMKNPIHPEEPAKAYAFLQSRATLAIDEIADHMVSHGCNYDRGDVIAIKIQIWVTLIANLLLTLLQRGVTHTWSFSGLATIVRIMLMYYIDVMGFLEHPEKDWEVAVEEAVSSPPITE